MKALAVILSFLVISISFAQLDFNKLKDKALKEVTDKVTEKVEEKVDEKVDALLNSHQEYDKESFNYAISFSDNAGLFEINEKYEKSKYLLNQYRNASTSSSEKDPKEVADDFNKTGEIFLASGKFHSAKFCFEQAISGYKNNGYENTPEFFISKSNLALSYHLSGRFNKALELTDEILALRTSHEPNTSGHGVSLNNKGVLLKDLGQYQEAEQLLEQALEIIAKTKETTSTDYVIVLNNIAQLYQTLGQYDLAEEHLTKATTIARGVMKEKSGNYTKLRINQALLYRDKKEFAKAEKIYQQSIETKKKRLGSNHPDYAHLTQGLASLYMEMGKYDDVEDLLQKAVKIYERKFNENHPSYATAISELGNFYRHQGDYKKAEPHLINAARIRGKKLGENHPDFIHSQEDLAVLKWKQGKIDEAQQLFESVINKSLTFIDLYFAPLSESEKMSFWKRVQPSLHKFYSFAAEHHQSNPRVVDLLFKTHTKTKSLILVSYNQVKEAILTSGNQSLINEYNDWLDKNENLARLYSYSEAELEEEKIDIKALEKEVNEIEQALSKKSNVFKDGYSKQQITLADLSSKLQPDEVLVDIIDYQQFGSRFTGKDGYIFHIIEPNNVSKIVTIDNGSDLNTKYYNFYKNAMRTQLDDPVSYNNYWQKVDKIVQSRKTVYVVPDGVYNQVNINTFKRPDGSYIIDHQLIVLLSHNKDFLKVKSKNDLLTAKSLFLMGNPNFSSGLQGTTRSQLSALPGTKKEIDNISNKARAYGVKVSKHSEENATEEKVKDAKADIIHIATHGYFLEDRSLQQSEVVFGVSTTKAKDNPLHRSGLLLTGADKTLAGQETDHSSSNNGVLTAFEIKNQNYSGTKLAVLSACETGLGEVMIGEGVYGLLRAFQEAGVESIITSLWKVDDTASQELMTAMYSNIFKTKQKENAYREAVLQIKKKYNHPYYWGAFILIDG